MLAESGVANPDHLQKAKANSDGLGLFVRSLVGLDREAEMDPKIRTRG
jgi:type I restriction enzyme R subunit